MVHQKITELKTEIFFQTSTLGFKSREFLQGVPFLKLADIAPENGPLEKEIPIGKPPPSGAKVLVSGRVVDFIQSTNGLSLALERQRLDSPGRKPPLVILHGEWW